MSWKKACSAVLFTISLAVLAVSGYKLGSYLYEEAQSDSLQRELAALRSEEYLVITDTAEQSNRETAGLFAGFEAETCTEIACMDGDMDAAGITSDNDEDTEKNIDNDSESYPVSVSSHGIASLNAKNPDCVAWITIEGTVIDYPVMYKPDHKDYYLHRDFNGKKSSNGTLYISEICNPYTSDNVIIYGHHMNSGRMFAALTKYKKRSFYEEHRYITFETLEGVHTYEVMFALTTPVYTGHDFKYYSFADAGGPRAFDSYISACAARSLYDTGVTAEYGDRLLTLSTCEYSQDNGRMLVVAKRID